MCSQQIDGARLNASLNGEMFEEVQHFEYSGLQIGREGKVEVVVSFTVGKLGRMQV